MDYFPDNPILVLDSWPLAETVLRNRDIPFLTQAIEAAARNEIRIFQSEMNLGELFYLVAKRRGLSAADQVISLIERTPIEVISVANGDVLTAAKLKAQHAISYADALLQDAGVFRVHWLGT